MPNPFVEASAANADEGSFPPMQQSELNIQLKSTDMMPKMLNTALTTATEVCLQTSKPGAIAAALKQTFEASFGGLWHCIVGQNFGSNVIHESRSLAFFTIGPLSVLLFKSGTVSN